MLPGALLSANCDRIGQELVPRFLGERDHVWLSRLLEEHSAFAGRRQRELDRHLGELPSLGAPRLRLALARTLIERIAKSRAQAAVPPKEARAATFRAASGSRDARLRILERVAASLSITVSELEQALLADVPSERHVSSLEGCSPAALAEAINAAIVSGWLMRATWVRVRAGEGARALARHAQRLGLICVANEAPEAELVLEISGPAALFEKTAIYGRALASLLPRVRRCSRFRLQARCRLPRSEDTAVLTIDESTLPAPSGELAAADERTLRWLKRDLERKLPDCELRAEPEPFAIDGGLVFPDLELVFAQSPRRLLIEIVGFWTPDYLARKLARLDRASPDVALVLCVDVTKRCSAAELPNDPRVLAFERRIDEIRLLERLGISGSIT